MLFIYINTNTSFYFMANLGILKYIVNHNAVGEWMLERQVCLLKTMEFQRLFFLETSSDIGKHLQTSFRNLKIFVSNCLFNGDVSGILIGLFVYSCWENYTLGVFMFGDTTETRSIQPRKAALELPLKLAFAFCSHPVFVISRAVRNFNCILLARFRSRVSFAFVTWVV